MQRYFVNNWSSQQAYISGDDYHHIVRVMRLKEEDLIACSNLEGQSAICSIVEITDEMVVANVVKWEEGSSELPVNVTIVSGLPKGDKLEWIIQKGTELGASKFIPFNAARSVVKWDDKKATKKIERLQKIAKEAAEQCHRSIMPSVSNPMNIKEISQMAETYKYKLIAYEEDAKQGESSALARSLAGMESGQDVIIVFGPEGGLTEEEVHQLREQGFQTCGLGPRILRTETAPLYALSAISYHFELMR